jgi:hypothetical protein
VERWYTPIIREAVEVVLPEHPPLEASIRSRVHDDVTAFVVSQVEALPSFLRVPYEVGVVAFDVLPLLRRGRLMRRLDAARRAAYVAAWDASVLAPIRNFVKLIRSCALLAYYDHPEVSRALYAERAVPARAARSEVS